MTARTCFISSSTAPPGGRSAHCRIRDRLDSMRAPQACSASWGPKLLELQPVLLEVRSSGSVVCQTHVQLPALPLIPRASVAPCQASLPQLWKGASECADLTGQPGLHEAEKVGKLAQRVLGPQNMPSPWLLLLIIITALLIHGSAQVWTSQAFLSSESFPNSTRLITPKSP